MPRIQIITIIISVLLLLFIARLIIKGKLREEYAIVWILSTLLLVIFSFWKEGFEVVGKFLQVYETPNLIFTAAIGAVLVYLLHLSVVVSKMQEQNKRLTQEMANMKAKEKIAQVEKLN
jgi:hypothetical protein